MCHELARHVLWNLLEGRTCPRTTSVCVYLRPKIVFLWFNSSLPSFHYLYRIHLFIDARERHTTHIHTINTENTFFFPFSFRETRHSLSLSLFPYFFSLPPSTLLFLPFFFLFSFRKLFSKSHAKPSNVHNFIKRLVDESCRSLLFSLTLSLRAPTITLSHRRPEQKGKSMKEKYDASARKSAFMLASWSTVLWFHFDEHMCECTCKCTERRAENYSRPISSRKRDHQISSIVVEKENEGVRTVCVTCMRVCVGARI